MNDSVLTYMQQLSTTLTSVVSRRRALALVAGSGPVLFTLSRQVGEDMLHPQEVLTVSESGVPLLWNLYFEGGLPEVELFLPGYLAQLDALTTSFATPSPYLSPALRLSCQGHQLASLLCTQSRQFARATIHARTALRYAEAVEDSDLQAAAQLRIAMIHYYERRHNLRRATYEHALQHWPPASPLIRARAHLGLAEVASVYQDATTARTHFEEARALHPAQPEQDRAFAYTHYNAWSFGVNEGRICTNLPGYSQAALSVLHRLAAGHSGMKEEEAHEDTPAALPAIAGQDGSSELRYHAMGPELLEVKSTLCRAALVHGDLELCAYLVNETAAVARRQGNALRLGEVREVFAGPGGMLERWADEPRVLQLQRQHFSDDEDLIGCDNSPRQKA